MDDSGNTGSVSSVATINANATGLLWGSHLASLVPAVSANSFAAKLSFNNGDKDKLHIACVMKTSDGQRVFPVYKIDSTNTANPTTLFTPYLNSSTDYITFVKINNCP